MEKRALQLFLVVLLLLSLQMFDYYSNKQLQLPNTFAITGAAVSESQTAVCAEASPCKSPTSWKCQSNSKCYDYSDCLFKCPAGPAQVKPEERKDEQPKPCVCSDWQTSGGCGQQGCPQDKIPQSKSCNGGVSCKTENRCVESTQCKPTPNCVNYVCYEGLDTCYYTCAIDDKQYEASECEQKCAEEAKAATPEGVDLVPRAEIKPLTVSSLEQTEIGDNVEITAYVGNKGTRSTTEHAIEKQQLSYTVKIAIEKISADGKTATLVATEYKAVSMVDKDIPPQGEAKVMSFVWKPATEGSYRVKIAVDINKEVTEAGEAGELNNEKIYELVVKPASTRLPDLVVGEGKISISPKVLCRSATVSTITATVKNIGRTPAIAQDQFLEAKVYVKEGGNVICSSLRMQNPPRWLVTINPGEEFTFMNLELTDSGGGECSLQLGKDYVAAVDVDTLKAVTESNEDNTFSAPIVDETKCEEAATRQGNCYCDFDKKPKTQKAAYQQCSHNFECRTELCIRQKCVSETQKKDILKILGIG